MKRIASYTVCLHFLAAGILSAQLGKLDFWDLQPINYAGTQATDSLAKLAAALASGQEKLEAERPLQHLTYVLEKLDVPMESQVLVFSKTSLQNAVIHPKNPRCLYFSENAYVGYVPGGHIEVIIQDAVLGPVYYLIETGGKGGLDIQRDTNDCFSCHATGRTEGVPGMLIRSVYPDESGHPLLHFGTNDVTHETPLEERWGGWYVTGKSALPHLGNRTFTEEGENLPKTSSLVDVSSLLDVTKYPLPTSDIVSLMVLEHQCKMHTLLNAASLNYRRAYHFGKTIDPDGNPDLGSAGRVADSWAKKIVDCLLFRDEADLGDGVEGDAGFQTALLARYPKTDDGDSLAEFRLYGRIFKNRCSYMVYSDAFRGLPASVKAKVFVEMEQAFGATDGCEWIAGSEKKRIRRILEETLEGWPGGEK